MLAKVCLKRFRFVLYAALFFLITLHITDRTNSGLIATLCIWFALPLAFIAFVWWIYAAFGISSVSSRAALCRRTRRRGRSVPSGGFRTS